MSQRPTIREQIDACRPDSDDLHLLDHAADLAELADGLRDSAEVRRQWERSQHNDRLIRSAMHDVSLPAGLEERLLAAVKSKPAAPLENAVQQAASQPAPASPAVIPAVASLSGRRWFIRVAGSLSGIAALLALAYALGLFSHRDQPVTKEQLAAQVEEWLHTADQPATWSSKPPGAATADFPDGMVLGKKDRAGSFFSSTGLAIVAYDLALDRSGSRATLLVVKTTQSFPVDTLPYTKLSASRGMTVGAWQRGGVLYVLAVHGGARLEDFLRTPTIG